MNGVATTVATSVNTNYAAPSAVTTGALSSSMNWTTFLGSSSATGPSASAIYCGLRQGEKDSGAEGEQRFRREGERFSSEPGMGFHDARNAMKIRDAIRWLNGGWCARGGSHRHYNHPAKPGIVTIAGHPSEDLDPKTQASILKQAGLKK